MALSGAGPTQYGRTRLNIWAMLRQLVFNDVGVLLIQGAPSNGTSGTYAKFAGPGTILIDVTNKQVYINVNTKASPTWSFLVDNLSMQTITGVKFGGGFARAISITSADTATLTAESSPRVTIATKASATQIFTLPIASAASGCYYTFICGHASGEILVNPGNGTDVFSIKATVDQGANIITAAGVGIKNTAATNVLNDLITVLSDGVSKWWMVEQSGIWASQ